MAFTKELKLVAKNYIECAAKLDISFDQSLALIEKKHGKNAFTDSEKRILMEIYEWIRGWRSRPPCS